MRLLTPEKLKCLQHNADNIRNLCIMAHVDHGKTTLADSLLASNGIISQKMAGKLRYMDSRKDEQERGITMKSSSITLYYISDGKEYLINLIDSPGHVDFSSEVSTAVRLCDGAIIVVDVVEGICPQTQVALKQAWLENIKPVLVLNKIDRLILELKLTPLDAYIHMTQVLEQVNVIMGHLFATDVLEKNEQLLSIKNTSQGTTYDWSSGLEQSDDSNLYFSPTQGNVVFASALDGWAFSTSYFAQLYSSKLGLEVKELNESIWGDFYLHPKTKKITPGAQGKAKKPLFVQLVLENIWTLYDTICVRKDKDKLGKIIENLGIKVATRDLRHNDPKIQLQAVCSQWLPVASSVLDMVCKELPPANKLSSEKVEKLLCSSNRSFSSYPPQTQTLKEVFLNCSPDPAAPVIVFVSKMFPVEKKLLPKYRPKALTTEELNSRRELARLRHAEKISSENAQQIQPVTSADLSDPSKLESGPDPPGPDPPDEFADHDKEDLDSDVFIAFARVFSGTVKPGQTLYVLGPKHDPSTALNMLKQGEDIDGNLTLKDLKGNQHVTKVTVSQLYIMMGRELDVVDEVPAGNVLGLGGLEDHILKTGTLSSVLHCPSFSPLQLMAVPILRVAVEPSKLSDLPALQKGLKLLNQADACVQVLIQETGEHVLITAGEIHLERCLDDLRNRYAKVDINASKPIVPFRETVIEPPKVDMVNEAIQEQNFIKKENEDDDTDADGIVTLVTPNKQSTIRLQCIPLPQEITELLEKHGELIRTFTQKSKTEDNRDVELIIENVAKLDFKETVDCDSVSVIDNSFVDRTVKAVVNFRNELVSAFKNCSGVWTDMSVNNIWCFGPKHCGPNILLNKIKGYENQNVWTKSAKITSRSEYDSSFVNGFQMASLAGPLCEEPMMGVAFIVHDWTVDKDINTSNVYGPLSGQIMSAVKEGCRKSFQSQPQRLMAAMYSCNILANAEVLGKLYAVLGRRQGRVLHGDMTQGSANFTITAILPVVESFNFAQEIRKQTSGLASPQLVFSHWEVIEVDPFWSPNTEEEYLHYGEKADSENRARTYMDSVRLRKGLAVQQKIVQFAEKQRTLSKKK